MAEIVTKQFHIRMIFNSFEYEISLPLFYKSSLIQFKNHQRNISWERLKFIGRIMTGN